MAYFLQNFNEKDYVQERMASGRPKSITTTVKSLSQENKPKTSKSVPKLQ